jgi:hypothetical protein
MKKNLPFFTSTLPRFLALPNTSSRRLFGRASARQAQVLLSTSFLLPLLVTACAAPASAPAQTNVIGNTALPTEVIENTALPAEPVEFTPIPTYTATAEVPPTIRPTADIPTITPTAAQPVHSNVIRFKANGTYTDITDSILTGASKTYSVNAMKGQIMSVSILPLLPEGGWGYIPIQIKGADGGILCPQLENSECMFWRGALPSSQDYFITLTSNGDVPQFIMRVAINPPGKGAQYFQYNNPATGVSLTYPDTFAPAISVVGNYKTSPELSLYFIDSETYDKTNLSEVYLFISSTSDAQVVATCTEPNLNVGAPEQLIGKEIINGYAFVHSTTEGAGAGNYYTQEIYRMLNKNVCHEVIYFIHYTNAGNYPPGTITEFDSDALMQKLYGVFSTFTIK